jgi:hypothetical protein
MLEIQLVFLPYHLESVTWGHRVAIVVELVLVWAFWPWLTSSSANPWLNRWVMLRGSIRRFARAIAGRVKNAGAALLVHAPGCSA